MSAGKHTPGPWHTGTTESTKYTIYSQLGFCIANSFNGVFVDAACEANAALMAAAPELLEYLQYAVWAHPELEKNEKLMAVIAKATGQEEGQ